MPITFFLEPNTIYKVGECPIKFSAYVKGVRFVSTIGYSVSPTMWDKVSCEVKRGYFNSKKIPYNKINARITNLKNGFIAFENDLDYSDRPTKEHIKVKITEILGRKERVVETRPTFYIRWNEFVIEESAAKAWAESTVRKFNTVKKHLENYSPNLRLTDITPDWISEYVQHMEKVLLMQDVSEKKELILLKWFFRWAVKKGYMHAKAFDYDAKTRDTKKPVIFLSPEELIKLLEYKIPANGTEVTLQKHDGEEYTKVITNADVLEMARDLFCFCCFTGLRYSDMARLRKTDIRNGALHITTQKTDDSLVIELSKFSQAILDKYADNPGLLALPVLYNKLLNECLKVLCELCGFNEPITIVRYNQGKRFDETSPKYKLMTSHAGRRTFICSALSACISPQLVMKWTGHSDYAAMKPYIDVTEKSKSEAMVKLSKMFEV